MSKAFTKETDQPEPPLRSRFAPLPAGFRNLITARGAAALRAELDALPPQSDAAGELRQRLDTHEVVPPLTEAPARVAFGATVTVRDEDGNERAYTLVGIDEAEPEQGRISWTSPLARVLLNQRVGSVVKAHLPKGDAELEIVALAC